jgi:hypothetical protein
MLKSAKISFNGDDSTLDCVVRNASEAGAGRQVETPIGVPDPSSLVLADDAKSKPCRTVWRAGNRIGVSFP